MKVLIAGAGRLGTQIAQVLLAARNEVTLIDRDDGRVADLRGRLPGVLLVAGDACEPALLEHAGVLTADLVVATTGDDEGNLVIALLAKRWFSVPRVAARVNDTDNTWLFDAHWGVDVAVPAATPLISLIEEATGATDTVALLRLSKAGIDVIETAITPRSRAVGRALGDIGLPEGTVVATIVRDGQPTVPDPAVRLRAGDELLLVSHSATEQEIHAAFQ
ncbi:TrkA family potassium uptake protein [Streptomyces griseoflavus]|uniref:potassium channel family protein n=1 Tax=Streptomyces griseoflavus TaxID=35619 RepID=UPI00167CFCAF|nr:TrkA family potassium uptake protein [Streptomyces griseoflavus]GGV53160.1 Trk system potassium uptake protein CeoC [Streptomyces griseoflavus]